MSGTTTSAHSPAISDDRLKAATGRSRQRWFALLDKAGAESWDRRRIARWLGVKHEVDAWWAQSLTIDYERARGLRQGRTRKGPLRTSAWKTIRRPAEAVWPFLDDDDLRRDWLDCEFGVRGRTPGRSLRLEAADGSLITVGVHELEPTSSGESRTQISVEHSGLHDAAEVTETKEFWKACLAQLAAQFE